MLHAIDLRNNRFAFRQHFEFANSHMTVLMDRAILRAWMVFLKTFMSQLLEFTQPLNHTSLTLDTHVAKLAHLRSQAKLNSVTTLTTHLAHWH